MRLSSKLLIVQAVFLLASPLHAQWQWSNPAPQGNDLWNVAFAPGSSTGWAAGGAGMIVKTMDGGMTWQTQECGHEDFFRGVEAVDSQTAWVVGDNGVVLKTSDGGSSWHQQASGTTAGINVIRAVSASSAAFVGDAGMLHTTTNGGQSWIPRSTGTQFNLNAVFFTSPSVGFAVGSSKTMIRTTDAGLTWTPVWFAGMTFDLIDVRFTDALHGWAAGTGGHILRSTDGGLNWITVNSGTTADLNRIVFDGMQNGWAAGEGGTMLRSTNGGTTWSAVTTGTLNGLEGLAASGTSVVAVGVFGDILRSANGAGCSMITSGSRRTLNAVSAAIPGSAWAVGSDGEIVMTQSAGQYWQPLSSGTTQALFAVDNINGSTVVACGNGGVIVRSTNGGQSWSSVSSGVGVSLNGIDLLDNGIGYIVGSSGRILKTTNGGAGWYNVASGTLQPLFGVHFTDSDHGTVVGAAGTVISTTNGGYTWSAQQGWTLDALFSVIREGDHGMICGDAGTVIYTDDGGVSWTTVPVPTTVPLFRLTHPAPGEYAAVGADGVIMRTSNSGQSWVREISHAMYTFYGADAHGGTVYAVGDFGLGLRNTSYPYPVELTGFTARRENGCVRLDWQTVREIAHLGIALQRSHGEDWTDIAFFPSAGTEGGAYHWYDCQMSDETFRYRLKIIGMAGEVEYGPEISVSGEGVRIPFSIDAWPQPVQADLHLALRTGGMDAALTIADAAGRIVYARSVDARDDGVSLEVPAAAFGASGAYIVALQSKDAFAVKEILVTK